jgi:hypothetical protein
VTPVNCDRTGGGDFAESQTAGGISLMLADLDDITCTL